MVYPTLLAAISDLTPPSWRASAVGVYRFWRDLGYAVGALLAGGLADSFSIPTAFFAIAALTFLSGILAGITLRPQASLRQIASGGEKVWAKQCW